MSELHVLFNVGDADLVLPASDVLHMESYSEATKVPGAPKHVAGLVQIRHRVVPVVDVRKRFGLEEKPTTIDSRVLVVKSGERAVGLLVDKAREVVRLAPDQFQAPPDVIASDAHGFITGVVQMAQRLLLRVNLEKLIAEERP